MGLQCNVLRVCLLSGAMRYFESALETMLCAAQKCIVMGHEHRLDLLTLLDISHALANETLIRE